MPSGNAHLAGTSVALPRSEFLAQSHISTVCTRVQYTAGEGGGRQCPQGSVYGHTRAVSPLLDEPLEGPVFLRSNGGDRELPDLVVALDGQFHVDLVGFVDSARGGGLRTRFRNIPDAPVTKFVLAMKGGKKGLLENSTNLCRRSHRAGVKMAAQNGMRRNYKALLRVSCGAKRHPGNF